MDSVVAFVPAVPGLAPGACMGQQSPGSRPGLVCGKGRGCPCYLAGLASEREAGCRSELAWSERRAGCPERTAGEMARATPTHARGCIKCYLAGLASERAAGDQSETVISRSPALERRPRPGTTRGADLVVGERGSVVGGDGRLYHDLHARRRPDRTGDELVAGHAHDHAGQPDRARADDAQRPSRHKVRGPVPGAPPGSVRNVRLKHPGPDAGARRLRLVRDPDLGRRRRDPCHGRGNARLRSRRRRAAAVAGDLHRQVSLLHALLGRQRVVHPPGHGLDQVARGVCRAVPAGRRARPARLGLAGGRRLRADLLPARPVCIGRGFLAGVWGRSHGDGRLLGHALAQHSGLLTVRPLAA